ncbi:MAG: class I SAM-dependent methyltransferase [Rhodospirillales bacterium]|jgi:SAM-dependent methyltransferase|nr:class I SAM-dependent methyltransferase [Rhodospirillales bacterium]MBT4628023.1 class I SAM-dependent methyltransferase [Rhodospirillales bacterium]MBT5351697.1 class I SAM-dependent methyltransferase [Rhodospirillales bacterium]MBT5520883.1 class I SAM-dependent methyltransferase [Rhodospirillales bacterium]MBT7779155.1 class I SAM-dependent methyltransferase [Rhodospirillales bacterium]
MSVSDHIKTVTSANREAWQEAAPIHAKHNQAELIKSYSQPGFTELDAVETERLKALGVAGKDVAQICCNNGRELLSVKNMGAARCVGFDGAQGFIDQGRELAAAGGLDVEFVCTDIYDIGDEYAARFDIVTITIGVLSWMPDLEAFFAVVAKLIRPGGALFIYEHHPMIFMIEPGKAGDPIVWELSYFDKEPYVETNGLDYYSGEEYEAKPATSFTQTMSEIIMAGVNNGLAVEHFEEYPHHISNTWYNVEAWELDLPMCFTLVFRKG